MNYNTSHVVWLKLGINVVINNVQVFSFHFIRHWINIVLTIVCSNLDMLIWLEYLWQVPDRSTNPHFECVALLFASLDEYLLGVAGFQLFFFVLNGLLDAYHLTVSFDSV